MEFGEKLSHLRKSRGMTQEELAQALFVSRTAVSKWESGRGYPNIETLKDISSFFSASIDDLLSGEKLLSIAEKENKSNIRNICDRLFGAADLFFCLLVVLPLYPYSADGYVYSVSLINYIGNTYPVRIIYWVLFALLITAGAVKLILSKKESQKVQKIVADISVAVNVVAVMFLALTRQTYAVTLAFLLLTVKVIILVKRIRAGG